MEQPLHAKRVSGVGAEVYPDKAAAARTLIKGGQVVNEDSITSADVYIEDGLIKQVGPNLQVPGGAKVIDASGKLIFPGGVDPDTHLQQPVLGTVSVDDFYAGTKAALIGGTTTIIDYVVPSPGESLLQAYDRWRQWADGKVCCDYALHVVVPHWNEKTKDEMVQLVKERGVNSFKFHMAFKGYLMLNDEELLQAFKHCKAIGAVAMVHAENGDVIAEKQLQMLQMGITGPEGHLYSRPEEAEAEACARAAVLANTANCPLYVSPVMSRGAVEAIGIARKRGHVVFGQTIAAAVGTDGSHYMNKCWRHAAGHVIAPPLRNDSVTQSVIIDALACGALHAVGSNNRTFTAEQKAIGKDDFTKIPHGVNGIEDRLSVVWEKSVHSGCMDPMRFVSVTSSTPAKLFGLYPKKGRVAVGSDADLVLFDPHAKKTISAKSHHQAVDFNVFEGLLCHGSPVVTIAGGKVVVEDGQVTVSQGSGKYLGVHAFPSHAFAMVQQRERARVPEKVEREAYGGPVAQADLNLARQQTGEFHNRPATKSGGRNMFDSSFSLSGAQIDDSEGFRKGTRISKPPGGDSHGLW